MSGASILVVIAVGERPMPLPLGIHLFCDYGGCFAVVGLRKPVGTIFDEAEDAVLLSFYKCPVQSGEALRISRVDVGAPSQ